jgi:hypothetical protein
MDLRYAVEVKPRGRGSHAWKVVAVCADYGDATYLVGAYTDMDGMRARVIDLEEA